MTDDNSTNRTNIVKLDSTIINQKKKLYLYVSQTKDLVWPTTGVYDYQVYVKNISGQTVNNLRIYVTNPREIAIKEKTNEITYKIPTLKSGQSVLININNCSIMKEGYYTTTFVAFGDETEIKTQTLKIKCGYENDNKNTLHRIAFYNFSPYESAYMERASDFNDDVTQLTKIQTKPFEAGNQPFEMDELELDLYAQDLFLTNTDDIPSMYLGRENWESNLQEYFKGETLIDLIDHINQESELVNIDFLRVGCNEMTTDFQRIYPNGFIHRFGLLKSEFYKLLGIIPRIFSTNDDLFRWARTDDIQIYPMRENDKWNQKPWCGTGFYVYEHVLQDNGKTYTYQKAIFTTESDALDYVDNLETFNNDFFVENTSYSIKKREWLPGVFFVEIPLKDIPANFYLPDIDEIQATIELAKPYGLKGYPRFIIEKTFYQTMIFESIPRFIPHTNMNLGEFDIMNYHIRGKRYLYSDETGLQFVNFGQQEDFIRFDNQTPSFYSYYPKLNVCKIVSDNIKIFNDNKIIVEKYFKTYDISHQGLFGQDQDFMKKVGNIEVKEISRADLISLMSDLNIEYIIHDFNLSSEDIYYISSKSGHNIIPNKESFLIAIDAYNQEPIIKEYTHQPRPETYIKIYDPSYKDMINQTSKDATEEEIASFIDHVGHINVANISYEELIKEARKVDYVVLNYGLDSETKYYEDICHTLELPNQDFLIVINRHDNAINMNADDYFDTKIACNGGDSINKSFSIQDMNSLYSLIEKNPEDISFYINDNDFFVASQNNPNLKNIEIPWGYKTVDYFDQQTSISLQNVVLSSGKIMKQDNLPQHVNVNLIFKNDNETKSFIISYKKIQEGLFKISYKTLKNSEVIVKEIVTDFDYILYDIQHISANKDLVQIYYALNNKVYFITSFVADLNYDTNTGYNLRLSITNDLVLDSAFTFSNSNFLIGSIKEQNNLDWFLCNKQYSSIISTDQYDISENIKSDLHWEHLYKVNKDETSFAYFSNQDDEETQVNDLQLYINNLKIPENSIVDKIYLDLYTATKEEIMLSSSYQVNTNLFTQNDNSNCGIFYPVSYNIYFKHNLKYLENKLTYYTSVQNEKQIKYYESLIKQNQNQNKNISIAYNAQEPLIIKDSYWNEVGFSGKLNNINSSDARVIYLILEGYNHGNDVTSEAQLVAYEGIGDISSIEIQPGYFYEKIPIVFPTGYNIQDLNIRFKFNNIQQIDLYDVKTCIQFSQPQNPVEEFIPGESIALNGLNKYQCEICKDISGDDVQNGLSILLKFDNVQNDIKVYSIVANIIYHEKAFTSVFETSSDFNRLNVAQQHGIIRGCVFDEIVSDMRQDYYDTKMPSGDYNAGFEMNHRIYQAFTATNDNITSVELMLNGKTGGPDNYLKISILDNYENLPNNVLKEVIINVAKDKPLEEEGYKYNIYVDNLIIGNTYWFSIEPIDKTKKGSRRFLYSNNQIGDFKLLSEKDGDMINEHASLYFILYTKQNQYPFKELPFSFDIEREYYKNVNLVTEIQVYDDGFVQNFEESLFDNTQCPYINSNDEVISDENNDIIKTLIINWDDNNNAYKLRPTDIQASIDEIVVRLGEDTDWQGRVLISAEEETSNTWRLADVLGYSITDTQVEGDTTIFTLKVRQPSSEPQIEPSP